MSFDRYPRREQPEDTIFGIAAIGTILGGISGVSLYYWIKNTNSILLENYFFKDRQFDEFIPFQIGGAILVGVGGAALGYFITKRRYRTRRE